MDTAYLFIYTQLSSSPELTHNPNSQIVYLFYPVSIILYDSIFLTHTNLREGACHARSCRVRRGSCRPLQSPNGKPQVRKPTMRHGKSYSAFQLVFMKPYGPDQLLSNHSRRQRSFTIKAMPESRPRMLPII